MKAKRGFDGACRHILNLLAERPMKWMDLRMKSRSAANDYGMENVEKAMHELLATGEIREIEPKEQIERGLRVPGPGAPGKWFEIGRKRKRAE